MVKEQQGKKTASKVANQSSKAGSNLCLVTYLCYLKKKKKEEFAILIILQ